MLRSRFSKKSEKLRVIMYYRHYGRSEGDRIRVNSLYWEFPEHTLTSVKSGGKWQLLAMPESAIPAGN